MNIMIYRELIDIYNLGSFIYERLMNILIGSKINWLFNF